MDTGLYDKFTVKRNDGLSEPGQKYENCFYFVLDMDHDKYAIPAIAAYASVCKDEYPLLSEDLIKVVESKVGASKEEAFNINDGVLKFNGNCEKCRPYCSSHCCKILKANLTSDEAVSGKYEMEYRSHIDGSSFYEYYLRRHRVPWSRYNVCVYLGNDHKCTIYDKRPQVCKKFNCSSKIVEMGTFKRGVSKEVLDKISDGILKKEDKSSINNISFLWASIGSLKKSVEDLDNAMCKDSNLNINDVMDKMWDIVSEMENEIVLSMNNINGE